MAATDVDYMARALELAAMARGTTGNNPAVGAVLVRDGRIVGEGFTQPPGQAHAEIVALRRAGELARGATLYVTLEPCCHFGRTPPCTDALIAAGVGEVHMAILDPNPLVAGGGKAALERAGVTTHLGEREAEVRAFLEAWLTYITSGRPQVIAKYAMTLDGKIATSTGESKWITGPQARRRVHELRAGVDAIMVGVNTVIADDPQLTARDEEGVPLPRQPLRLVVDSTARVPISSRVVSGDLPGATAVLVGPGADPSRVRKLEELGNSVITVPRKMGRVDLEAALRTLGTEWGITSVLVEGGGELLGSLFDRRLVDKLVAFVAPKLVGGAEAPGPVGGKGVDSLASAVRLKEIAWERVGDDLMIVGYVDHDDR
jgi:diaminohydroxyphosphoribosylaminopyrimidine deaminase/5-amino-6-(5-phosphoribosylamino)uracil reductase